MADQETIPVLEPSLLTPRQLSARIGVDEGTLSNWRKNMRGPVFVKLDTRDKSRVRYPIQDVIAWEQSLPRQDRSMLDRVEAVYGRQ
jgi:hypothetical protein